MQTDKWQLLKHLDPLFASGNRDTRHKCQNSDFSVVSGGELLDWGCQKESISTRQRPSLAVSQDAGSAFRSFGPLLRDAVWATRFPPPLVWDTVKVICKHLVFTHQYPEAAENTRQHIHCPRQVQFSVKGDHEFKRICAAEQLPCVRVN